MQIGIHADSTICFILLGEGKEFDRLCRPSGTEADIEDCDTCLMLPVPVAIGFVAC